MDRFTWVTIAGVLGLCLAAIISVVVPRPTQQPPDLNTPDGVTLAYIAAIRDKRGDDAWAFLDSPQAVEGFGPPGVTDPNGRRDQFRNQVNNNGSRSERRVRVVETKVTDDTARVDIEVTSFSDRGLFGSGSYSSSLTFNLKRQGSSWRITSSPSIFQLV